MVSLTCTQLTLSKKKRVLAIFTKDSDANESMKQANISRSCLLVQTRKLLIFHESRTLGSKVNINITGNEYLKMVSKSWPFPLHLSYAKLNTQTSLEFLMCPVDFEVKVQGHSIYNLKGFQTISAFPYLLS